MTDADPQIPRAVELQLRDALARRGGKATLGDVVRDTGLARERTEQHMRAMLSLYRSHLAVDEDGELLYLFDPAMERRTPPPRFRDQLARAAAFGYKTFMVLTKVSIMVILIAYVLTFCVLIIAAFLAMLFAGGDGPDLDVGDLGGDSGCLSGLGEMFFFWDPGTILYVPYIDTPMSSSADRRRYATLPTALHEPHALEPRYITDSYRGKRTKKRRLHDKIFDFLFGPSTPEPPPLATERELLAFVHRNRGVLTMTELITRTGSSATVAEEEMTRLLIRYGGDIKVTEAGTLLYTFDELRLTAGTEGANNHPAPPTWHRFEPDKELTGNTTGTNVAIGSMAGFTLLMAIASPILIFPILNIAGTLALTGLAIIPALVSLLFFVLPVIRAVFVGKENERRFRRNIRRALLLTIFGHVTTSNDAPFARQALRSTFDQQLLNLERPSSSNQARKTMTGFATIANDLFSTELDTLLAELDADIDVDANGATRYTFPRLLTEMRDADEARANIGSEDRAIGEIIFSSADDDDDVLAEQIEAVGVEVGAH